MGRKQEIYLFVLSILLTFIAAEADLGNSTDIAGKTILLT